MKQYTFGGQNYSAAGFYTDSLTTQNGCDSVVVLDLSVLPVFADTVSASICSNETYTFGGQNYSTAGFYADSLTTQNGCDSVVVLNLSVLPISASAFADTIFANQTYSFGGQSLTATGTYSDTLQNNVGCDSVVTLNLTVWPVFTATVVQMGDSLVASPNGSDYSFVWLNNAGQAIYWANR